MTVQLRQHTYGQTKWPCEKAPGSGGEKGYCPTLETLLHRDPQLLLLTHLCHKGQDFRGVDGHGAVPGEGRHFNKYILNQFSLCILKKILEFYGLSQCYLFNLKLVYIFFSAIHEFIYP